MSEAVDMYNTEVTVNSQDIDSLVAGLRLLLLEEVNKPFEMPQSNSALAPLAALVEQLRLNHVRLLEQTEIQTVGEGEFEIKRRRQMREISGKFTDTVGQVAADLINSGYEGTKATEQAALSVDQMMSSSEEIRGTIEAVTRIAQQSSESVRQAVNKASNAIEISDTVNDAADQILKITAMIEAIALQTNMLSLNAKIEAARAGAHGAGFAVVASEVKELSNKTTTAAGDVRKTAKEMQYAAVQMSDAVQGIRSANEHVSDTTSDVIGAINDQVAMTHIITERAKSSNEQMAIAEQGIKAIQAEAIRLRDSASQFVDFIVAEHGVTDDTVSFGQSAPYTGPAASIGEGTRFGIELSFRLAERDGGIHGRVPKLIGVDDGYDPDRALQNVRSLVREGEIFGLVGAVGTPTSKLSERIARGGRVPFIGPVTGTSFLRHPDRWHVINVRASYEDEAQALISTLSGTADLSNSALFMQADAYGYTVRDALLSALQPHGYGIDTQAGYDRTTGDISEAINTIVNARPSVVFMASTAAKTAEFIKAVRQQGIDAAFATISFVGSAEFARQVGSAGEGVIVSQVVPPPDDLSSPLVQHFRNTLQELGNGKEPGFAMLEGFVIGKVICEMLNRAGRDLDRERFLQTIISEPVTVDICGMPLRYGPRRNDGTSAVYVTQLNSQGGFSLLSSSTGQAA